MSGRTQPLRQSPAASSAATLLTQAANLRSAGGLAASVAPLTRASELDPANALIFHDLGLTFLELGQSSQAVAPLRRAIFLKPNFAEAHWRLGLALEQLGDADAALLAHQAAVQLRPGLGEARLRLAALLEAAGRRTEALGHFRRAASSARDAALRRIAEARALKLERRDADAQKALRRAIALAPNDAAALDLLGASLAEAGAFEAAAELFERSLAQSPTRVGVYYDLVRCNRVTAQSDLVERMTRARAATAPPTEALVKLNLALGKAFDDLGQYAAAMSAFDTATDLRNQLCKVDLAAFERQVDQEISRFTPGLIAEAQKLGSRDPTPVMVLGMPRSGTTLCEQILSSHPQVGAAEELPYWTRRGGLMQAAGPGAPTASFVSQAAQDYLRFIAPLAPGALRITDKMPTNFLWAGLIHLSFPKAAIIHCRRSPIDTALSIHQVFFSPKLNLPSGGEALVAYYRLYERMMDHWRRVLPPDRFIELDYETLTADPEPQIRRIVAAIGLDWHEACLHPERNNRVVRTPSKWQARQPINRGSVDRWRRYEPHLGPLAALVG